MADPDIAALRVKLDELSDRLSARVAELRTKGGFSEVHETLVNQIRRRNDALRARVAEAENKGSSWELIKAELVRDYSSLFDDLLEFEERLDTGTMKRSD